MGLCLTFDFTIGFRGQARNLGLNDVETSRDSCSAHAP